MIRLSYLGKESFLNRIGALEKFSELLAVAFLAYIITNPFHQLLLFLALSVVILGLGKVPFKNYLVGMSAFFTFGFVLLVMQILFYAGPQTNVLFTIGDFEIKETAFKYGVNLGLRVFVLGSSVLSFIMTTEPRRMIYDMVGRAHIPYRFAYGFYSALRFIPIFEEEAGNIMNAHKIRGSGEINKGLIKKLKVVLSLGAPLLVSGLRKAKSTAIAMDARAFGAYEKRTLTYTYPITLRARLFGVLPWVIFLAYLVLLIISNDYTFLQT